MKELEQDLDYWNQFYKKHSAPSQASSFAEFCIQNYLNHEEHSHIAEFGCGNGRDSFYFAESEFIVSGVDISDVTISQNQDYIQQQGLSEQQIKFYTGNFAEELVRIAKSRPTIDAIYSRFTMHAVPYDVQLEIIARSFEYLREGGLFLVECRTINDPLMQKGTKVSESERITDHYRRFIDCSKFINQLLAVGFLPKYFVESNGLAVYKDDDPVVARFVFTKPEMEKVN